MRGIVGEAALIDSGASENFIDQRTVERWGIATKKLLIPVQVTNVDGTTNRDGAVNRYAILHVTRGNKSEELLFLVANLGKDQVIFGFTWLKAFNPKINWTNMTWDDLPIEVATCAVTRARFLGVEDHARQRLREADIKRDNKRRTLAYEVFHSNLDIVNTDSWKTYFPEYDNGVPKTNNHFKEPTEFDPVEKYVKLWRHQKINNIRASIRHDRQQVEWKRTKIAELRASSQEPPELDTSNHPELVEFRRVFPQYLSGITAISSPRNSPPPAASEVKTLDLAHCIEVNKTSMATQWAIDAPKEKTSDELPREYAKHYKVFSEDGARRFSPSHIDDHEIKLKPGAPTTIPGKTYPLNPIEMEAAKEWINENEQLGYIE
jgi:hypothetical protein